MSGSSAVRRLLPVSRKQLRRSWKYINAAVSPVHFNNPSPLLEEQSRGLRVRSLHCSAPGPATTDAQGRPRSDQDDLPMSLDHFRKPSQPSAGTTGHQEDGWCDGYTLPHPVWSEEELNSVQITHTPLEKPVDTAAYYSVQMLRTGFDLLSGYSWGKRFGTLDEKMWLPRIIYLETVAGVPGMIGAMVRHLKSLRCMTRDHGWIHTLLEEAENEDAPPHSYGAEETWTSLQDCRHWNTGCVCEYVLDSVFPQSQILPQVCWLLGGRGSQDLHSLH
ncbi:Alternative oxidase, mitochondrial [Geodia barretti]|uniref:Alternative oxidase, mitochondrial n=1 Tax=Geodia barretti TaxID=519541 RepID=A0AA35S166_GEOBA|nr:Alternative oxidase, mitochondrial [Geodia barretti]